MQSYCLVTTSLLAVKGLKCQFDLTEVDTGNEFEIRLINWKFAHVFSPPKGLQETVDSKSKRRRQISHRSISEFIAPCKTLLTNLYQE